MNDESTLKLAEAINRLAAALEKLAPSGLGSGVHVYHHGIPLSPYPGTYGPQGTVW